LPKIGHATMTASWINSYPFALELIDPVFSTVDESSRL
jgi:hypothetical protein